MLTLEKKFHTTQSEDFSEINEIINRARLQFWLPPKKYTSNISFKRYEKNIWMDLEKVYILKLWFEWLYEELEKLYWDWNVVFNVRKVTKI